MREQITQTLAACQEENKTSLLQMGLQGRESEKCIRVNQSCVRQHATVLAAADGIHKCIITSCTIQLCV